MFREYDDRMQRLTITVPDKIVAAVRERVAAGDAKSVSAYFARAAHEASREDDFKAILDRMDDELGPPGKEAEAWADGVMSRLHEMDTKLR